jgi:signal transduction histidine kinase/DNA-binding response OmpR family regulator/ligand-binding sensor domain-containing protein
MHDPQKLNDIGSNIITHIIVNEDGSLWLGTFDNGLTHMAWDNNGNPTYLHYNKRSNHRFEIFSSAITALYKESKNLLWIGTMWDGLIQFDPESGTNRIFRHAPQNPTSLSHNTVSSICEDDSGYLWIGTGHILVQNGGGLNRFDPITETFRHYKNDPADPTSLCSDIISCLEIDKQNVLWIGTVDNSITSIPIADLSAEKKPVFRRYQNFWQKIITSIYEDRLGNIWISPQDMQIYKYDRQQNPFIYYGPISGKPGGMKDSGVECLYIDKKGNIWFGHHFSGLDKYDPVTDRYTHFPHIPGSNRGPSSNWITGIREDARGNMWISTYGNGMDCYNPVTGIFRNLRSDPENPNGLRSNYINFIVRNHKGALWIAAGSTGLQLFDMHSDRFFNIQEDWGRDEVGDIVVLYEDCEGKLWVGTSKNGIYGLLVHDRHVTAVEHYFHDPHDYSSLGNNSICDIVRPQVYDTSALWIATDNGLNRLDLTTKTFTHFYEKNGLPDNYILSVLEDNSGNIWVSTTKGISKLSLQTNTFRNYDERDGLPFNSFGGGRQNTAKSADGQLFFSSADGSIGIYPARIRDNPHIPPVRLTDFKIFHESVKLDTAIQFLNAITLTHDQNTFSFRFAALNFTNPDKNQYAYKMVGFQDEWIPIGIERTAGFTNLDPGTYVFRVKGSNNHGVWNEEGTSVKVIILPPWWSTWWAYSVYLLIGFGILYTLRRYDLKRQRLKHQLFLEHEHAENLCEIDYMKSRFFANISHEFRTPLTLILGPIKKWMPKLQNPELKDDLNMMQRNANRLYRLINQLLDLSRLESGGMTLQVREENIISLLRGYVQSFESLAKIKKVDLGFTAECESLCLYADRDKIEKIMYNLLSNAFKFTPLGGHIMVHVGSRGRLQRAPTPDLHPLVIITVSNTGSVIPANKIGRIFDRFYQVDASEIRGHEGSGIGLALTKELVELHHGEITVESTVEHGTIFTICLLMGKEHLSAQDFAGTLRADTEQTISEVDLEPDAEQKRKSKIGKNAPRILMVDDNRDVRYYIRGHLESLYQISESANGKEGLQTAIAQIPDLIISDVMMPEMDGFELCRRLKTDERTSHIPVILLTARATSEDKIGGLETGADDYLTKPFDIRELQMRIKNLMTQREKLRNHYLQTMKLESEKAVAASADQMFLAKINTIVEKHMADAEYSIELFVQEVGFSHSQLVRKLESITGLTPSLFIRSHRLLRARQLLDQKTGTISQIAFECGFNNLSYFSRSFEIQFGQLPSDYLKNLH